MRLEDYIKLLWLSGFSTSEAINYLWENTGVSNKLSYVELTTHTLKIFMVMDKGFKQFEETKQ